MSHIFNDDNKVVKPPSAAHFQQVRRLKKWDGPLGIYVSTAYNYDGQYETIISHPKYGPLGIAIVAEYYDNRENASESHDIWVDLCQQSKLPEKDKLPLNFGNKLTYAYKCSFLALYQIFKAFVNKNNPLIIKQMDMKPQKVMISINDGEHLGYLFYDFQTNMATEITHHWYQIIKSQTSRCQD